MTVISRYGRMKALMEKMDDIYKKIAEGLRFHFNSQMGFLTVDPFRCGTAVKVTP